MLHKVFFSIQPTLLPTFKTSENEVMVPSTPHSYFYQASTHSIFIFLQVYENVKFDLNACSVIIQRTTHFSTVLSPRCTSYIKVPATNVKPPNYEVKMLPSLFTPYSFLINLTSLPTRSVRRS